MTKWFSIILGVLICAIGSHSAIAQDSGWQSIDDYLDNPSDTQPPEDIRPDGAPVNDDVEIRRKIETPKARRINDSPRNIAILPGDDVIITIKNVESLSGRYSVAPDGHLDLPLIGRVSVSNMRPIGVESLLSNLYGRDYLQNPKISVTVKPVVTTFIMVQGKVNRPGKVMTAEALNLRETLSQAGQLRWNAKNHNIFVYQDNAPNSIGERVAASRLSDPDFVGPIIRPGGRIIVRNTKDIIIKNPALARTPKLRAMMRVSSAGGSYF